MCSFVFQYQQQTRQTLDVFAVGTETRKPQQDVFAFRYWRMSIQKDKNWQDSLEKDPFDVSGGEFVCPRFRSSSLHVNID
jgi:hypothetical protein